MPYPLVSLPFVNAIEGGGATGSCLDAINTARAVGNLRSRGTDVLSDDTIKLDQFLKWTGMTQTGGEAKLLIQSGEVRVNGAVETRRGRKLAKGDRVSAFGSTFTVE